MCQGGGFIYEETACAQQAGGHEMAFSQEVKDRAYRRAGGRCECTRLNCGHRGRCNASLANGWNAHHILSQSAGGYDGFENCEALCIACHKNTASYGRS
jgi:hypothetical protein